MALFVFIVPTLFPLCADTLTCYNIISDNFQYFVGKNHGT